MNQEKTECTRLLMKAELKITELESRLAGQGEAVNGSDMVLVPRDLLGAAAGAINLRHPAPKTLAEIRRYALTAPPAQSAKVPEEMYQSDSDEHPKYIEGWNACRAAMLAGKNQWLT